MPIWIVQGILKSSQSAKIREFIEESKRRSGTSVGDDTDETEGDDTLSDGNQKSEDSNQDDQSSNQQQQQESESESSSSRGSVVKVLLSQLSEGEKGDEDEEEVRVLIKEVDGMVIAIAKNKSEQDESSSLINGSEEESKNEDITQNNIWERKEIWKFVKVFVEKRERRKNMIKTKHKSPKYLNFSLIYSWLVCCLIFNYRNVKWGQNWCNMRFIMNIMMTKKWLENVSKMDEKWQMISC